MAINFLLTYSIFNLLLSMALISMYLTWNNFFMIMLSMEFAMLFMILNYSLAAYLIDDLSGYIYSLSILVVVSVETVMGLLMLLNFINLKFSINMEDF